jgi:hypothetical protein
MNLRLGYIPILNSSDTVFVTTTQGDVIAQLIIDTSNFAPIVSQGLLTMSVPTSYTNTFSAYQFSFISTNVVFDKQLTFTLPSNLNIYGQCSFSNNITSTLNFTCSKVSANSISIMFDIDQNLMIPQTIIYTISISNVSTPSSLAPLLYTFSTTFDGIVNQQFTTKYSMQFPYPISLVDAKTNFTLNQQF